MQVYVTINLSTDSDFSMTSLEAATAVLAALGGDPAKDVCTVQATIPAAVVGVDPSLPPAPDPVT